MQIEKLFYKDTKMVEFHAIVTDCIQIPGGNHFRVVLDRTSFFPEEGGQAADQGVLDGQAVRDVQLRDGMIYHELSEEIEIGRSVKGCVDWTQRFDFMQQHSGEHILSGLVNRRFGYNNVGFHLGTLEVTLDFNGPLSWEQLRRLEQEANEIIWQNLPVKAWFPDTDELSAMSYRSKTLLTDDIRIVEIPGVDICACCAPHVDSTGQIGILKITNVQSHRGGVRINILCGGRALADYSSKQDSAGAISVLLSVKQDGVLDGVLRLKEENQRIKERGNELQAQLLDLKIASLPSHDLVRNVLLFTGPIDSIAMRSAVNGLCQNYQGYCGIMSGDDECGYHFVIGSSFEDCRELAGRLKNIFQAKGGGSAPMIQGSVAAEAAALTDFWNTLA